MPAGVVLDTSFLITLAGPQRSNFKAAREYWKHFIENGIPIFLPTIAILNSISIRNFSRKFFERVSYFRSIGKTL
jgi:hypothetical protein